MRGGREWRDLPAGEYGRNNNTTTRRESIVSEYELRWEGKLK